MAKVSKEKFKTYKNVFDKFIIANLFKLISQNHFEGLESPLFVGKESNIFTAETKQGKRVIVKIYRLETCDFKRMYNYLRFDTRYLHLKRQRRKIIFAWAEREFKNLSKAYKNKIKVPKPITFLNNILVMEMIGKQNPALQLKDEIPIDMKKFSEKLFENIKKLYKADLIHGDLSKFNILNYNETPYLIDFSQATTTKSPIAMELLERDIRNMVTFFNKHGLALSETKIKKKILNSI